MSAETAPTTRVLRRAKGIARCTTTPSVRTKYATHGSPEIPRRQPNVLGKPTADDSLRVREGIEEAMLKGDMELVGYEDGKPLYDATPAGREYALKVREERWQS